MSSTIDLHALEKQNAELAKQIELLNKLRKVQKATSKGVSKSKKHAGKSKSNKHGAAAKPGKKGSSKDEGRSKRISLRMPGEPITVRSPKTHAKIMIGGKKNKAFRDLVSEANAINWKKNKTQTDNVVNVLAQAYKKWGDVKPFEPWYIPYSVQKKAAEMAGMHFPRSGSGSSSSSSSDSDGDCHGVEEENFQNKFIKYFFDMTGDGFGSGVQEDLARVQSSIMSHLKFIRMDKFHDRPFKMYLEYTFLTERSAVYNPNGDPAITSSDPQEETVHTICTAEGDSSGPICVRHPSAVDEAVGRSYAMIMKQLSNLATKGSGHHWLRSVGMRLCVSKQVDGVPINGRASDKKVRGRMHKISTAIRQRGREDTTPDGAPASRVVTDKLS
jgi:hypothetical protein